MVFREERPDNGPVWYYSDENSLNKQLLSHQEELQCVVSKSGPVMPGQAQFPSVSDYADGVDTLKFLFELK